MEITKDYIYHLTYEINGAAIEVHKALGPGLLESIYHKAFAYELDLRKINFQSEFQLDIMYKGAKLGSNLRCDLFVEESIVLELKTVECILPVHKAQLLSYMKLLNAPKGILYNFNVDNLIHSGQQTMVSQIFSELPSQ